MSAITMTRKLEFDAGHRVFGHGGKCHNLHGHRYVVEATCSAPRLDDLGMVVDFGVVKQHLGTWLDKWWDHAMILSEGDPLLRMYQPEGVCFDLKLFVIPRNPTAENMAKYLAEVVWPRLEIPETDDLVLERMVVHETPNCRAEWMAP